MKLLVGWTVVAVMAVLVLQLCVAAFAQEEKRQQYKGLLNQQFHAMWPVLLGVYWVNAAVVVMNYQFVNGLLFTMAGMLAAQQRCALKDLKCDVRPSLLAFRGSAA
jgi:hypothetical protein